MTWGLEDVRVGFGRRIALDGVTVPAGPASVTVVVGGDGAGKSTCLKTLVGLVRPQAGSVRRPAKERIGYVPATAGLYADLTVQQNLDFTAGAYRLPAGQREQREQQLLERTGLAGVRRRLGGQLSGGMQRKLAVALALLHAPDLLVLDEPTTGVDPVSRAELWRLISAAAAQGTAVVVGHDVRERGRPRRVRGAARGREGPGQRLARRHPARRARRGRHRAGRGAARPGPLSWRRGVGWRVWAPDGELPAGVERTGPDFDDAVVVAELAAQAGR